MKLIFVLMGFKIGDLNDHHPMCTWIDFFHYFGDLWKINGHIKNLPKVCRYAVPTSWYDNYCYVCVCNSVSGTALAICSQSKGELNSYSFCWQCTHTDQPTDVRLFVCMLILTVHVIIIFTHSAMNAVEVGFSFLWASSTIDGEMNLFFLY